ncbi:hypothetical protein P2318_33090 [Myxococcaceae bacterium GXIMD 01537]
MSVLLGACGTARHAEPSRTEELTRQMLILRELPDGQVSVVWRHVETPAQAFRGCASNARLVSARVVRAMNSSRDCDAEFLECVRECMSRPLPRGYGHITSGGRGLGGKEAYCERRCMQPYLDCMSLKELRPQEFTAEDGAVDWLKRHRDSLLEGSIVIIAGVAFMVASSGVGVVVLAPVVLLASGESTQEPCLAEVSP